MPKCDFRLGVYKKLKDEISWFNKKSQKNFFVFLKLNFSENLIKLISR